ncbi:VQ motif containing protein [Parasponia andersonii]|uniref:VQ motif containing protein n=1 Tax=Parasponia andersonii TaxID=3476 RepID=A0A2P5AFG2_PARAD|nr:VQ motif containing protein [Parasponia andersonii]
MGKKVSQSKCLKTSKSNEKKDFNSWIKVLRPKVYITDSSSFKQLVQELTGNGTTASPSAIPSPPPMKPRELENVRVIEIEEDQEREPESSVEASIDATADWSTEFCNNQVFVDQDFNQVCNEICLEDINLGNSVANQQVDLLAYWDIESWLLDGDSYGFYNGCGQIEQDVSIYDYELSGLI